MVCFNLEAKEVLILRAKTKCFECFQIQVLRRLEVCSAGFSLTQKKALNFQNGNNFFKKP